MEFIPGFSYNVKVHTESGEYQFNLISWKIATILIALCDDVGLDYEWDSVEV